MNDLESARSIIFQHYLSFFLTIINHKYVKEYLHLHRCSSLYWNENFSCIMKHETTVHRSSIGFSLKFSFFHQSEHLPTSSGRLSCFLRTAMDRCAIGACRNYIMRSDGGLCSSVILMIIVYRWIFPPLLLR